MKYKINYGNGVGVFPKSVFDVIARAGSVELKVLLGVCSLEGSVDIKKLSKLISCPESDVKDAISFWRGAGIIEVLDGEAKTEFEVENTAQVTAPKRSEKMSPTVEDKGGEQKKKLKTREEEINIHKEAFIRAINFSEL